MANENETVGQRLRSMRQARGHTLAEVAERSGLSIPYISNLEMDRANPTLEALESLAQSLDVPMASLVGNSSPTVPLQEVLASAPQSLVQFSRSPDFQKTVQELADRQGESLDVMRQRVLAGMASSTQRSADEPTEDHWQRILGMYALILKPSKRGLALEARHECARDHRRFELNATDPSHSVQLGEHQEKARARRPPVLRSTVPAVRCAARAIHTCGGPGLLTNS